ncbi:MAG: DUF3048 domain-containing protein [Candidatus Villigracilaceae bacterium]
MSPPTLSTRRWTRKMFAGLIGLLWLTACTATPYAAVPSTPEVDPIAPAATPSPAYLIFTPVPTGAISQMPTAVGYSPVNLPESINPLTGLPVDDPKLLERRPMAVKVTNFPRYARPQYGLSRADLVFEYYIEDYMTRFTAIFYGQDAERIGPVRSGRFFDEHLLRMYHAYLIFKGADKRVFDTWKESPDLHPFLIVAGSGTCPWYCVMKTGHDEYNSYFFNSRLFQEYLDRTGKDNAPQSLRPSYFYTTPPASLLTGEQIFTRFSRVSYHYWQYDPLSMRYLRYQETEDTGEDMPEVYAAFTDALTGEQVAADNLVVLFAAYTFADTWQEEDEVFHVELTDAGRAFVFRNGLAYEALWHRTDRDQPLLLTDLNGEPLPLKPGTTFFEVLGNTSTYLQEQSIWRFQHNIP